MEYVRIAILDAYDSVQTYMDNNIPTALHYYSDDLAEYLKGTAATYSFTVPAKHTDSVYLTEGNKLSFKYRNKDYYMNIMHVERDEFEVTVEAYSLSFELLNEQRGAYKASSAMSFEQYLNAFDPEHVITLGINEASGRNITHEWEGEDTILARLFSLATVFSAELEFLPELNDDYSLKRIIMNVYDEHSDTAQGVGQRRTDLTLRYNHEISGITKISDITELYTAITPTGRDGLTLASLDKTEYDSEGNVEYRKPAGSTHLYAVQARDRFPSNLMANENERYIGVNWEYDTDNINTLYGQALSQLKKNCVPKVSYEVEGYFDTGIGDTVTIADESFNPELYLEARVTEQHRSFTDPSGNKTTFDNFKELQNQIDDSLLSRVEELIAQGKTYTAMISADNGIVFRNGVGETTMTAHIRDAGGTELAENYEIHWYKDGSEVYIGNPYTISADDVDSKAVYRFEAVDTSGVVKAFYEVTVSDVNDGKDGDPGKDGVSLYTWIKYADTPTSGMSDVPDGKQYMGIAYNKTSPAKSENYEDYQWSLITGEGVPGAPGEDGKTYYTWIRYADNAQGDGMSDNPDGKDYIGLAYNKETPTESNNPADYTWSLFRGPQGIPGKDGKTFYTWIKYADTPTSGMSDSPDGKKYMGIAYNKEIPEESSEYSDYAWSLIVGQGVPGTPGEDGKTLYTWVKYADDAQGSGMSNDPTGKNYIGLAYNKETATESNNPGDYTWSLFRGPQGIPGEDGKSSYIHIRYSSVSNPTSSSQISATPNKYIGIQISQSSAASTDPNDYTWAKFEGDPGDTGSTGPAGQDGKTPYIHFAYANSADGQTDFSTTTSSGRSYMGQYADYTESDSTDPSDYTWVKVKGEDGSDGNPTGITVSSTEPEDPYIGMLWKHTGTVPGLVKNATYRWDGSTWELYLFVAENLSVESLSALSADLGHVTAGSIVIPWSISGNPQIIVEGSTEFSNSEGGGNPLFMQYTEKLKEDGSIASIGYSKYGYDGIVLRVTLPNGITREVQLTYTSLIMGDGDSYSVMEKSDLDKFFTGVYPGGTFTGNMNNLTDPGMYYCNFANVQNGPYSSGYGWIVNLRAFSDPGIQLVFRIASTGTQEMAMRYYASSKWYAWSYSGAYNYSQWSTLTLASGYTVSENRTPQYRISAGKVEFKGQIAKTDGGVINGTMFSVPSSARPEVNRIFQCADNTYYGCRVAIATDGTVQARSAVNSTYVSLDGIFYYL